MLINFLKSNAFHRQYRTPHQSPFPSIDSGACLSNFCCAFAFRWWRPHLFIAHTLAGVLFCSSTQSPDKQTTQITRKPLSDKTQRMIKERSPGEGEWEQKRGIYKPQNLISVMLYSGRDKRKSAQLTAGRQCWTMMMTTTLFVQVSALKTRAGHVLLCLSNIIWS